MMTRLGLFSEIFVVSVLFLIGCSEAQQYQQQQNYGQNQNTNTQNYVTVNCSQGAVQGRTVNLGNDPSQLYSGQANVFSGIPYCQPPVGNLRLQPPQPMNSFNTSLHDATYFRPKCPQQNGGTNTNEDCLYLNIYTPQVGNNMTKLAVLVMIDGSNGFSNGGCDQSQVKGIVSNLVQRQIVVVTLQYRIGALGFFTTYTNVVQPNLGMQDQVQAMQWIKSEIVNFGGDPNKITVAGQDDGACAVSAHCLSPMSQNLFNQAIVQSGSIYSCYNPLPAVPTNPTVQTTTPRPEQQYGNANSYNPSTSSYNSASAMYDDPNKQLAETLCNISSDQWNAGQTQNLQNCLKNYTVDFFVNQKPNGPTSTWLIVRDNTFLPDSIDNLSSRRPNIPIIIGTVQDEDADYAFKLINNGKGGDPSNMQNWIFDFARKNKLNQTMTNQVSNIINQNYGVNTGNQNQNQAQNQNPQYDPRNQQTTYQDSNQNQNTYQYDAPRPTTNNYNNQPQYQNQNQNTNYQYTGFTSYQQNTYTQSNNNQQQVQQPQYQNQNPQNQNQQYSGGQGYQQNQYQQPQNTNQQYQNQQYQNQNNNFQYDAPAQNTNTNAGLGQYNSNNNNGGYVQQNTQQIPSGATDYSQLRTLTQVASDQSVSLTTTQVQSFMQNGNRHVRLYQFTHVSEVGRQNVPNTGPNWKPVFKGQDMYFITMSETIWTNCNYTNQDRQVANNMGQQWSDFVKTGQVANWDTTSQQNYNYCNLNTQPTQQAQYGQQARQVFQDQINPICQQAQNDYAVQNNLLPPFQSTPGQSNQYSQINQYVPPPTRRPGTAQAQYTNGTNGQNFHLTFQVNSFPFNG